MITNFQYQNTTQVIFGAGALNGIGDSAKALGEKGLVVTTGEFFVKSGLTGRIQDLLKEKGIESEVYIDVAPNPKTTQIDAGAEFLLKTSCEFVIGLGGGSAMDAAKAIAVAAAHEGPVWDYSGAGEIVKAPTDATLPIIAVTTTSGTGSQVTSFAVVSNPDTKVKVGMGNVYTYPDVSIIDPELMVTLPPNITAATGFDTLAHAIEAYTSNIANPITDLYAEEAIRLIGENLREAFNNGTNIDARCGMALADTLAGYALANAVCTLAHCIAQVIGGLFDAVHGVALAILTPACVRFSMNSLPDKFKKIGALLCEDRECECGEDALECTVKAIEDLRADIGLNIGLGDIGVKESDFDKIGEDVLKYMIGAVELDARMASKEDIIEIMKESF